MTAHVVGVGACSPLGLSSLQVAMGLRADRFEPRSSTHRDRYDHPIGCARMRALSDDLVGFDRFAALGARALKEAAALLPTLVQTTDGPEQALPLFLALPEADRPDQGRRFQDELLTVLSELSGARIDLKASRIVRGDHAAFALALQWAKSTVDQGTSPTVLVGAIDSYFHADVLAWLDEDRRLRSYTSEHGIVPSEAAAFLTVASKPRARNRAGLVTSFATIPHVETAREAGGDGDAPNLGETMTDLVRRALAAIPSSGPRWFVTDRNLEHHRVREWSFVEPRISEDVRAASGPDVPPHVDRYPEAMGNIGVATGAVALAIACRLWAAGCAPAPSAVFTLQSEGAERAAFVGLQGARE